MKKNNLSGNIKPGILHFNYCLLVVFAMVVFSCNQHKRIGERNEAAKPAEINELAKPTIEETLKDALENNGRISDTLNVKYTSIVQYLYSQNNYTPIWTHNGSYLAQADSLFSFINNAKYYGLFPQDYYQQQLTELHSKLAGDSVSNANKLDASLWAEADMLFTSAFAGIVKDLKVGRLAPDSTSFVKNTSLSDTFFLKRLASFQQHPDAVQWAATLEPQHPGYHDLKEALKNFLTDTASVGFTEQQNANLLHLLRQNLNEDDASTFMWDVPDSVPLSKVIKRYQKSKGMTPDGKVSALLWS
jgi:murein L,D-transpeptidase YcbB/YkuD